MFINPTLVYPCMSEEVEQRAGKLVEEVEEPLSKRKKEAINEARKAEQQDDSGSESVSFWSPPIAGGEQVSSYQGDQVKFYLSGELPNGTGSFKIDMPGRHSVTDRSHRLNRLLSVHGVDVDRIADMNNERIPLIPIGSYDRARSIDYRIDYPPIPTLPNMLLYRIRRLAMRLRLIEYRTTPSIRTDMFNDIAEIDYSPSGGVPAMSSSAYPYYRLMSLDDGSQQFVPSELCVGALFMSGWLIPSAVVFALAGGGVFTLLMSMLFLIGSTVVNTPFIKNVFSRVRSYVKTRFFPSPE